MNKRAYTIAGEIYRQIHEYTKGKGWLHMIAEMNHFRFMWCKPIGSQLYKADWNYHEELLLRAWDENKITEYAVLAIARLEEQFSQVKEEKDGTLQEVQAEESR